MILTWLSAVVAVFCSAVSIQLALSGHLWLSVTAFVVSLMNFGLAYWHSGHGR